ncbi:MAG: LPS export ABC transporter permease LptG [Pseudomonadota bacterium]
MTLHLYFARRFLWHFLLVLAVFAGLLALLDLIDQVRRFADDGVSFPEIVQLTLLKAPQGVYRILPLIMVIATVSLFVNLARTSELVVARAAGRSALRTLAAPAVLTVLLGIFATAALNPIVAATAKEYEARVEAIGDDGASTLSLSASGLWLRQGAQTGQTVIRADRSNLDGTELLGVTFMSFTPEGTPTRRIEASRAALSDGAWELSDAKSWPLTEGLNPEANALTFDTLRIPSTLTRDRIRDSFGAPFVIPIWDLPSFIDQLRDAGFSARRHATWLQMELAQPAFLLAMLLIGAGFTMRHARGGKTGQMVLYAILLGFALYFVRNFAQILGESGQMPIWLAAWAPPLGAMGLALGFLLHQEDG